VGVRESCFAKTFRLALRVSRYKWWLNRSVTKQKRFSSVPWFVRIFFRAETQDFENGRCVELIPRWGARTPHRVVYFHGGAFVLGMLVFHWDMILRIGLRLRCRIVVGQYPRAPQFGHSDILRFAERLFLEQEGQSGVSRISLLGDSAGATLALSLVRRLQQKSLPLPAALYLLSPWLDLSMSTGQARSLERGDVILDIEALKRYGTWYARDRSPRDPDLSPHFADYPNLPPTWLFACTSEVFLPDLRDFVRRHPSVNYHEYQGLFHGWVATRLPESRAVIDVMARSMP